MSQALRAGVWSLDRFLGAKGCPGLADGVVLSPVVSWAHDLKGRSALRGRAGMDEPFGGTDNNARDRDFVNLSAGLKF